MFNLLITPHSLCWTKQRPHHSSKQGRDRVAHKKELPDLVQRYQDILAPSRHSNDIQSSHRKDSINKWFGVSRDAEGLLVLSDYGRLRTLLSAYISSAGTEETFPQVVAFIGVTNAGKSALVKMLINHRQTNDRIFPSPVVGSMTYDTLPTSGDVHLYADPSTSQTNTPLLYADCEGFEGGERAPLGSQDVEELESGEDSPEVSTRPIPWATTSEFRQREHAVTNLYPRILYTFSDCVVFVLRNPKTFQSAVLTKLLDWGAAALERSLNQPVLPHCILVVNACDPNLDVREWGIDHATRSLLSSIEGAPSSPFIKLAEAWRARGAVIKDMSDLIHRYYSSFSVIRIPSPPLYTLMHHQIDLLHRIIQGKCEQSIQIRDRTRTADELDAILRAGFEHFASHADLPFDFMETSVIRNPIPDGFGGHILCLCTALIRGQSQHQAAWVVSMLREVSRMLASCVLLDCVRFHHGRPYDAFARYESHANDAITNFIKYGCPCAYVSRDGRRCQSTEAWHEVKGHQDGSGVFATGPYEPPVANFGLQWRTWLSTDMESLSCSFQSKSESLHTAQDDLAWNMHLDNIRRVFSMMGSETAMRSHSSCFICLMSSPEHILPCGHVFCHRCTVQCGVTHDELTMIDRCPLHPAQSRWPESTLLRSRPATAGLRVLSLDGGGNSWDHTAGNLTSCSPAPRSHHSPKSLLRPRDRD